MKTEEEKIQCLNAIEAYQTRVDLLSSDNNKEQPKLNKLNEDKKKKKIKIIATICGKIGSFMFIGGTIVGALAGFPIVPSLLLVMVGVGGFVASSYAKAYFESEVEKIDKARNQIISNIDARNKEISRANIQIREMQDKYNKILATEKAESANKPKVSQALKPATNTKKDAGTQKE